MIPSYPPDPPDPVLGFKNNFQYFIHIIVLIIHSKSMRSWAETNKFWKRIFVFIIHKKKTMSTLISLSATNSTSCSLLRTSMIPITPSSFQSATSIPYWNTASSFTASTSKSTGNIIFLLNLGLIITDPRITNQPLYLLATNFLMAGYIFTNNPALNQLPRALFCP